MKLEDKTAIVTGCARGIGTDAEAAKIPLRRLGQVEDCAGVPEFLATDLSQDVTGQGTSVCGGAGLTPNQHPSVEPMSACPPARRLARRTVAGSTPALAQRWPGRWVNTPLTRQHAVYDLAWIKRPASLRSSSRQVCAPQATGTERFQAGRASLLRATRKRRLAVESLDDLHAAPCSRAEFE